MCVLASSGLRALHNSNKSHARHLALRLSFSVSRRHFLVSPSLSGYNNPTKGSESAWNHVPEEVTTSSDIVDTVQEPEGAPDDTDGSQTPSRPRDLSGYGSAARRAGRHIKRPIELPQFILPSWFLARNVFLREELSKIAAPFNNLGSNESLIGNLPSTSARHTEGNGESIAADGNRSEEGSEAEEDNRVFRIDGHVRSYEINENILNEISSLVRADLESGALAQSTEACTSSKTDLLLYHPKNGGTFFLDELVTSLAATHSADLIILDPQDIADIGGDYVDDSRDTHTKSLRTLGYDVYPLLSMRASLEDAQEDEEGTEEDDVGEEDDEYENKIPQQSGRFGSPSIGIIPISQDGGNLMDILQSAIATSSTTLNDQKSIPHMNLWSQATADTIHDLKLSFFLEHTLNASEKKRQIGRTLAEFKRSGMEPMRALREVITDIITDPKESTFIKPTENLIIYIKDYMEINSNARGGKVLDRLHNIVKSRRKENQKIIVIGTSSCDVFFPEASRTTFSKLQAEPETGPVRTIITPCYTTRSEDLTEDHELRVAMINLRNIQNMLSQLSSESKAAEIIHVQEILHQLSPDSRIDDTSQAETVESLLPKQVGSEEILDRLKRGVWSLDAVHHIATVALGLSVSLGARQEDSPGSMYLVVEAIKLLTRSQAAKIKWVVDVQEEQKRIKSSDRSDTDLFQKSSAGGPAGQSGSRFKKLRKICNNHEKKLLSGVVDPGSIRTTFADVRAPPETINALKTLTSLSLVRPDAFTYGVLATDKIPGLLLYGPPGTGKSLLARATAKESGAAVLEVSGADVYDMYVGEGEKNVKAIFSLAKKLSPCIVFIDEADAILGARGGSSNRTTHREMINQFLREWDGMGEISAFIMVATNRPFDLDEASLRRLPRRLLVDLPTEEDREAILKIHLKNENLDPDVSLAKLASQTPFYSGSDLKNLAVAAALSCVREEVETAASQSTDTNPSSPLSIGGSPPSPTPKAKPATKKISSSSSSPPPHVHPEKRTLAPRHFTHALEEISASISDDMSSLTAIRKFDEKFGDRRGKRKKIGVYGFETVKEGERKLSDRARVRNLN